MYPFDEVLQIDSSCEYVHNMYVIYIYIVDDNYIKSSVILKGDDTMSVPSK